MNIFKNWWGPLSAQDWVREFHAGLSGFLACAYIVVVNPIILSQTGMNFNALVTSTVLVAAVSTVLMGLYGKNPFIVAPGMGLNAFFTYSVVKGMGVTPEVALGSVFISGVCFLIFSVTGIRNLIVYHLPKSLRPALSCGIGLFISLIGFVNAGFVTNQSATPLAVGLFNAVTFTFLLCLLLTVLLVIWEVKGAFVLAPLLSTLLCYPIGRWYGDASYLPGQVKTLLAYKGFISMPDFSLLGALDITGALSLGMIPVIMAFVFTDLFDSLSTFTAVAQSSGMVDERGHPKNLHQSLIVDAFSTLFSGLVGSSAGTTYIESAVAIRAGAKTGFSSVVAGLCFIPLLFFSPLLSMIPALATSPVLILVGAYMMKSIQDIQWDDLEEAFPAFLAMVLIPYTYSIGQGIIWGIFSYTFIKIFRGKIVEIGWPLFLINAFCMAGLWSSH